MYKPNTILLVENDLGTAVLLITELRDQGFRPLHATDGHQGLRYVRAAQPDLVLLDALLPRVDGFAVCSTLRQESVVPIIMLSPNGHATDRVRGLELGADDYMVKPFSFPELVARIRALLRRRELDRRLLSPPSGRIVVGDIVLDRAAHQVRKAGRLIQMPGREYGLLRVLMEHAGRAVPHRELLDQVWGEGWVGYSRTLNVHIYRLRQKLEDDPSIPNYIRSVRGYGYRFIDPTASNGQRPPLTGEERNTQHAARSIGSPLREGINP